MNEVNKGIPPQLEAPDSGGNDSGRAEIAAAAVQHLAEFKAKVEAAKQDDAKTPVAKLNALLAELPDIRIFVAQIPDSNQDQLVLQLKRELLLLRNSAARREFTALVETAPQRTFTDIQAGIQQYVSSISFSENVTEGTPEFEERNKIFLYRKFGFDAFINAAFSMDEATQIVAQIKKFDAPIASRYEQTYQLVRAFVSELFPPPGNVLNYGHVRTALEKVIIEMGSPLLIKGTEIDLRKHWRDLPIASGLGVINELSAYGDTIGSLKVIVQAQEGARGLMPAEAEKLPADPVKTEQPDQQKESALLAKYTSVVFSSDFKNVTWEQYVAAWDALKNWQQSGLSKEPVFVSETTVSGQAKERTAGKLAAQVADFQAQLTAVNAENTVVKKRQILLELQRRLDRQKESFFSGMIEPGLRVFLQRAMEQVLTETKTGGNTVEAEAKPSPTNIQLREKYGGRIEPSLHSVQNKAEAYYVPDLLPALAKLEELQQAIPETVQQDQIPRCTGKILRTLLELSEVGYVFQLSINKNGNETVFEISAADLRTRLAEVIKNMPANTKTEAARKQIMNDIRNRVPTVGNLPQLLARIYGVQDIASDLDNHTQNVYMQAANQKQTPAPQQTTGNGISGFFGRLFRR